MGFFAEFSAWLNALLTTYISDNATRIAAVLEPAVITFGTIYVMVWGYLQLTGQIQEPFIAGVKRIAMLAIILGAAIKLWLYNEVIVDTFFNAPAQLAASVVGAYDPVGIVDEILDSGADTAELLLQKAGLFNGNASFYMAGAFVYIIVSLAGVYVMFLLALSRIALSVLLAVGPLFIALLMFESTKRFFESWLAQLANYALITIVTVLVAALMLALLTTAAHQAVSAGGGIQIAQAARVCMAAGLTFLVMRQVMPMAAGLASGLALSTFGVVSSALAWAWGGATRSLSQFSRGTTDRETTRWDSLSRKSGYYLSKGISGGVGRMLKRRNQIRA
jgi:type IV secretion system protein VirB6